MPPKELRILCFGNSLTAGFHHYGLGLHPYSLMLKTYLEAALPETKFDIATNGLPGDMVTGEAWKTRLKTACKPGHVHCPDSKHPINYLTQAWARETVNRMTGSLCCLAQSLSRQQVPSQCGGHSANTT